MIARALIAGFAVLALTVPAAARDLRVIAGTPGRTSVLLDHDTIKDIRVGGRPLREAVVSTDEWNNGRTARGTDNQVQVACDTSQYRIVWTRAFAPDGAVVSYNRPLEPRPLEAAIGDSVSQSLVDAICGKP